VRADISGIKAAAWAKDLRTRYSPTTVGSVLKLLSLLLADAAEERLIAANPIRTRRRGRRRTERRTERIWATPAEVLAIADNAAQLPNAGPAAAVLIVTAAWTGARWGEIVGLQCHNTHLNNGCDHGRGNGRGDGCGPSGAAGASSSTRASGQSSSPAAGSSSAHLRPPSPPAPSPCPVPQRPAPCPSGRAWASVAAIADQARCRRWIECVVSASRAATRPQPHACVMGGGYEFGQAGVDVFSISTQITALARCSDSWLRSVDTVLTAPRQPPRPARARHVRH
jgi:hypothetical protein